MSWISFLTSWILICVSNEGYTHLYRDISTSSISFINNKSLSKVAVQLNGTSLSEWRQAFCNCSSIKKRSWFCTNFAHLKPASWSWLRSISSFPPTGGFSMSWRRLELSCWETTSIIPGNPGRKLDRLSFIFLAT